MDHLSVMIGILIQPETEGGSLGSFHIRKLNDLFRFKAYETYLG